MEMEQFNEITGLIIKLSMKVHTNLGAGLYEGVYKQCLYHELSKSCLDVKKELPIDLVYNGIILKEACRLDLLVNNSVVVELKTVDSINSVHKAQLLTYMRFGNFPTCLLLNFNSAHLKDGIVRMINSKQSLNFSFSTTPALPQRPLRN